MKRCSKLNRAISVIVSFSIMTSAAFVFRFPFFGTARAASLDAHTAHSVCAGADVCPDCEHEADEWKAWTKTDALPDQAGHFYLTDNVVLKEEWSPEDDTFLCLNGKTITQTMADKRVIRVALSNKFTLSDCRGGGKITGGSGISGAGIYNNGTFMMFGGIICGNNANSADPEEGGGICNDGLLKIYGGAVSDNSADIGGGIFNRTGNYDNVPYIMMYGGTISDNKAVSGGGVYNDSGFLAYGGKILNNMAEEFGGGIFNNDALELNGSDVLGNSAKRGGGVYISDIGYAKLVLQGGELSGNIAEECGGGIFTESDILVRGGRVTKNTSDNSADNIYLALDALITVFDELPENSVFGITTEEKPGENTAVYVTEDNDDDLSAHFFSDDPRYKAVDKISGEAHYITLVKAPVPPHIHDVCAGADICPDSEHTDEHLDAEWQAWTETGSLPDSRGYYYLTENVTLDGAWDIRDDITLCLNGKKITQRTGGERVIRISPEKSLSLCDCTGGGLITGGNGAVYNRGTFNLYSGVLSGSAADNGGGVFNDGEAGMFMYGGTISGCTAAENGGGVYIDTNATFAMYGGAISGNRALTGGGVADNGTFIVCGGKVVENTSNGSASNVYLAKNKTITVGGTLTAGSRFGVTAEEKPADGASVAVTGENTGDFSRNFFSDSAKYDTVGEWDNGKHTIKLVLPAEPSETHTHPVCGDSSCREHAVPVWQKWSETNALPTKAGHYFLAENVRLAEEWQPSGEICLCLNGKTITQTSANKRAVRINADSALTLCDCGNGGGIIGGKAGGVRNDGTLVIFGGEISGSTAENGGGILNNGHFVMNGGSVTNNEAVKGGGIYNAEGASFDMRGGLITGNRAELGGGVFQNGRMTINGGSIVKSNSVSNVYLPENKTITLSDNLAADAEIGVSTAVIPSDEAPVRLTGSNSSDLSGRLFSDNGDYRIELGADFALMLTSFANSGGDDRDENTPGGNKPGDNAPDGNKPGGNEPGDNTPGGNEPGDTTSGDNKPGSDTPVIESDLYLDIKPVAPSDIPENDRAVAEKYIGTLNGWKFGQYYKIDLYRKTENSDEKLTRSDIPVYITVAIPGELSADNREFALMRIYDGIPKLLADTDSSAETVTVVTDRFSTYALLYRDKTAGIGNDSAGANGNNGSGGGVSNPDTGREDIPLAIPAFASAALMLALPAKHRDGNAGL